VKDKEIQRLTVENEGLNLELGVIAGKQVLLKARDAKLADRVDALHDDVVEGVSGEVIEKQFSEIAGLLRGEKTK